MRCRGLLHSHEPRSGGPPPAWLAGCGHERCARVQRERKPPHVGQAHKHASASHVLHCAPSSPPLSSPPLCPKSVVLHTAAECCLMPWCLGMGVSVSVCNHSYDHIFSYMPPASLHRDHASICKTNRLRMRTHRSITSCLYLRSSSVGTTRTQNSSTLWCSGE